MVQSKHATMVQIHVQGLGAPRWICANTSATTRDTNAVSDGGVADEDGFAAGAEDGADGAEGAQADRQGAGGGGGRGRLLTSTGGGTAGGKRPDGWLRNPPPDIPCLLLLRRLPITVIVIHMRCRRLDL